jgi:hypothetical protein
MFETEKKILQLQMQIQKEKSIVKQAIRKGAIFEEIKTMTLNIKEMEKTLDLLRNQLHGDEFLTSIQ